jgi:hypothetical protein
VIRRATGEFAPEVIDLLRTFATQCHPERTAIPRDR